MFSYVHHFILGNVDAEIMIMCVCVCVCVFWLIVQWCITAPSAWEQLRDQFKTHPRISTPHSTIYVISGFNSAGECRRSRAMMLERGWKPSAESPTANVQHSPTGFLVTQYGWVYSLCLKVYWNLDLLRISVANPSMLIDEDVDKPQFLGKNKCNCLLCDKQRAIQHGRERVKTEVE